MADTPIVPASTQAPAGEGKAAPEAPKPGTPEYDAAMAEKGKGAVQTPAAPAAPARPEGLPEKFKTVADMVASYAELEKKLGTPAAPAAEAKPGEAPKSPLTVPTDEANKAVQNAGLDMAALDAEWKANGDLKPESYAALEKSGIPKAMVDSYISGQKALAAQYDADAFATAGGEESYTKMVTWAKTGLQADEIKAFDKAVTSGDRAQMKLAVAGLKSRFEAKFGSDPSLLSGGGVPSGDVYESTEQMKADMRKPEYKKDPAFRAKVAEKIGRSPKLGVAFTRAA